MADTTHAPAPDVDRALLTPLVCQVLDQPEAEVLAWRADALTGGVGQDLSGILGITRFCGTAQVQGEVRPWSLVRKRFAPPAGNPDPDPTAQPSWVILVS